MKNIIEIFRKDIKEVFRKTNTWIIIVGLIFLPSMYAWPNILSSWDPYGHTNNIKVAVTSEDEGATVDGKELNLGNSLVEGLKNNKNLDWQFVSNKQEAEGGVRIGDYYASIVVPKNFSQDMTSVSRSAPQRATIEYTVNEKINAISPKITNSGASAIANNISKNFVETANGIIFEKLHEAGIKFEENLPSIEKAKEEIFKLNDNFSTYESTLSELIGKVEYGYNILNNVQNTLPEIDRVATNSIMIADKAGITINNIQEFNERLLPIINNHLNVVEEVSKEANMIAKELQQKPDKTEEIKARQKALDSRLQASIERLQLVKNILEYFNKSSSEKLFNNQLERVTTLLNDITTIKEINNNIYNKMDHYNEIADTVKEEFVKKSARVNEVSSNMNSKLNVEVAPLISQVLSKAEVNIDKMSDIIAAAQGELPIDSVATNSIITADKARITINNIQEFNERLLPIINNHLNVVEEVSKEANMIAKELQQKPDKTEEIKARQKALDSRLQASIERLQLVKNILEYFNKSSSEKLFNNQLERVTTLLNDITTIKEINNNIYNKMDHYNEIADTVKEEFVKKSARVNEVSSNMNSKLNVEVAPLISQVLSKAEVNIDKVSGIIAAAQGELPAVERKLSETAVKISNAYGKLLSLQAQMPSVKSKIQKLTDEIKKADSGIDKNQLFNLLKVDYKQQAEFFANPVKLQENKLYHIENYGSAMTPFYTVLSIWVGSLLMSSLLTTKVEDEEKKYKPYQKYFGRGLLFVIISLFQTLIITLGDMYVLGTQATSPYRFVLYALLISLLFSSIIYTIVCILGNVGKAVCIVLLVLQLGSSGGTFPIQMTSEFFQALYPKVPFTYSIGLLREAVGGVYIPAVERDIKILFIYLIIVLVGGAILVSLKARSAKLSRERERSKLFL